MLFADLFYIFLSTLSQGIKPILNNFLTPILRQFFHKTRFLPANENLMSHFFLLAFSFAPCCFVLVLRITIHTVAENP